MACSLGAAYPLLLAVLFLTALATLSILRRRLARAICDPRRRVLTLWALLSTSRKLLCYATATLATVSAATVSYELFPAFSACFDAVPVTAVVCATTAAFRLFRWVGTASASPSSFTMRRAAYSARLFVLLAAAGI
eukprot:9443756-Prorocentrum_lima.AAC.1